MSSWRSSRPVRSCQRAVGVERLRPAEAAAEHPAIVELLELVAVHRVERVGEVGEELEAIVHRPGRPVEPPLAEVAMALARHGVAMRLAAARGIDEAEAADRAVLHGAQRNLVGRRPLAVVGHEVHRPGALVRGARVARDAVRLPEVLRQLPGAVRGVVFEREQQVAARERQRAGRDGAEVTVLAAGERENRRQPVEVAELGGAGGGKIAELRVVRALVVGDALDQLRDHEVEVHVALAVPVRRHVDRHAFHARQEVGAVVEVEAAQEILVRLAVARCAA